MMKSVVWWVCGAFLLALAPSTVAQDQIKSSLEINLKGEHDSGHTMEMERESHTLFMNFTVSATAKNFQCTSDQEISVEAKFLGDIPRWAGASFNPRTVKVTLPNGKPGLNAQDTYQAAQKALFELNWNAEETPEQNHVEYQLKTETTFDPGTSCTVVPDQFSIAEASFKLGVHMAPAKAKPSDQCEGELATLVEECQTAEGTPTVDGGSSPSLNAALAAMAAGLAVAFVRRKSA